MKRYCLCICVLLGFTMSVSCQNRPEPHSVVEKAIEAHGGEKNLGKPRIGHIKTINKAITKTTQEETFDLPKRYKRVTVQTFEGVRKVGFNLMIEGKYWAWETDGKAEELIPEQLPLSHFASLPTLLVLKDKKVKLSALAPIRVEGQRADGIRGEWNDKTVDCYFDKKTGLWIQMNFKLQLKSGDEVHSKIIFSDHKEFDGVIIPYRRIFYMKDAKVFKDYQVLMDLVITEAKILDSIPEEVFKLPE